MKKQILENQQGNSESILTTDQLFSQIIFNSDVKSKTGLSHAYISRCRAKIKGTGDLCLTIDQKEKILSSYGAVVVSEKMWAL